MLFRIQLIVQLNLGTTHRTYFNVKQLLLNTQSQEGGCNGGLKFGEFSPKPIELKLERINMLPS